MSKTCILCHIVFGTKSRERAILQERKKELYAYIFNIIEKRKCKVIRINGVEDHVHILLDLHPTIALSDLVKSIKQSSSNFLRDKRIFPNFNGWGNGYYAASISIEASEACRRYIINQENHHLVISFSEELEKEIRSHGLEWYEEDLM